jgi:hypothetical protein
MSGIFDKDSDLSTYQVSRWRPSPFKSGFDAFSPILVPVDNIFDGILADVAGRRRTRDLTTSGTPPRFSAGSSL